LDKINSAKTGVYSVIPPVSSVETPVYSGDNPTKGKGNIKGNKKKEKKKRKKELSILLYASLSDFQFHFLNFS